MQKSQLIDWILGTIFSPRERVRNPYRRFLWSYGCPRGTGSAEAPLTIRKMPEVGILLQRPSYAPFVMKG